MLASTLRTAREDPAYVVGGATLGAEPGREQRPVDGEVSSVSPMVAPTTAPKEPSGSAPALRRGELGEHGAADGAASGGGVLHLAGPPGWR